MLFSASVLSICRNEQAGGFIIFYWQILPLFWGYEYMLRSVTVVYYKAFSCCTIIADLVLLLQVAQRQNICNANGMMPHSAKALEIALHSHRCWRIGKVKTQLMWGGKVWSQPMRGKIKMTRKQINETGTQDWAHDRAETAEGVD